MNALHFSAVIVLGFVSAIRVSLAADCAMSRPEDGPPAAAVADDVTGTVEKAEGNRITIGVFETGQAVGPGCRRYKTFARSAEEQPLQKVTFHLRDTVYPLGLKEEVNSSIESLVVGMMVTCFREVRRNEPRENAIRLTAFSRYCFPQETLGVSLEKFSGPHVNHRPPTKSINEMLVAMGALEIAPFLLDLPNPGEMEKRIVAAHREAMRTARGVWKQRQSESEASERAYNLALIALVGTLIGGGVTATGGIAVAAWNDRAKRRQDSAARLHDLTKAEADVNRRRQQVCEAFFSELSLILESATLYRGVLHDTREKWVANYREIAKKLGPHEEMDVGNKVDIETPIFDVKPDLVVELPPQLIQPTLKVYEGVKALRRLSEGNRALQIGLAEQNLALLDKTVENTLIFAVAALKGYYRVQRTQTELAEFEDRVVRSIAPALIRTGT